MVGKKKSVRLFSLIVAAAMLLSMTVTAGAMPTDVIDAKDEIATVDITQKYNGVELDTRTHNYATDGTKVGITYSATLKMTEEMAMYLNVRQKQLMKAQFDVNINIDNLELLEFVNPDANGNVTVYFTSTFLKPVDSKDYTYALVERDASGVFKYAVTVSANLIEGASSFTVPMELIVYYDGTTAYGYEAAAKSYLDKSLMYADFTVEDWMHEITLSLAEMKVKDGVDKTVTYDQSTWKKITATGTVDGTFSYIGEPASSIQVLKNYEEAGYVTTLEFGNENTIEEWTSNEVWVYLIRFTAPIDNPDSPFLNLEDHFAYIIGMPDGLVHPEWTITRAEVATIFFRMLTDDVRNQFWCQTNPYYDVDINDWYNNAISTLTNLGVVNGMPDGGFHPTDNITRGEFATMAVRFFLITENMYGEIKEDAFSDIADHWANKYINMAYLLEIVHGYPDGTFRPGNVIDRAEAMTIVNNTLRRSPCNEGIEPVEEHEDFITWPDNMDKTKWYYAAVQEATNSHDYTYFTENKDLLTKELWVDILPVRDWAAFERAWSDANSAYNPGEVVNGK